MQVLVEAASEVVGLEDEQDDAGHLAEQLDEVGEQALLQRVAHLLLLVGGARLQHGALAVEDAPVAAGDGGGEERELLVVNVGDLLGVLAHALHVAVDDGEPHLGVGALQVARDVAVEAVVVEDDVEVVAAAQAAPGLVLADGEVAAVGVAVQGCVVAEDHFVEDTGEAGGDFVAVDAVGVEVLEVVQAVAGYPLHDEDALL